MKYLGLIALLLLVVAEAHHTQEHTLRGPRFSIGKVHIFDVEFNVTSGVRGLSSQVSKTAFKADLHVYAKTEKEHVLKVTNVYTSGSLKAVGHKNGDVPMHKNRELEDHLSTPIKFTMENGKVTRYTLSPTESLESKKIKKAILRTLEMHVPEPALEQMEIPNPNVRIPVTYNMTEDLGFGLHTTQYLITVSPNVEFPYDINVYNISRSENFEGEQYHSHIFHHNFRHQGCPEVCKMDWADNKYGAGCPVGYEPHHTPMKMYVHQQHHLALEYGVMTPEIIKTVEIHIAKMYDQDMEVLIRHHIRKSGHSRQTFEEPTGQTTYTDLNEQEPEIDQEEIDSHCEINKNPRDILEVAKTLLREIASVIVQGNLENKESTIVGEKIILLKRALSQLSDSNLKHFAREIVRKETLKTASEEEKVKRQIWMDILPTIGTSDSVRFIVDYIKENIERELFVWEAKEILEALPVNIHTPTEENLKGLRTLLSLPKTSRNHLLHSAAHLCLSKVISLMCNGTEPEDSAQVKRSHWPVHKSMMMSKSNYYNSVECPKRLVSEIVMELTDKLTNAKKHDEIVVYIDSLVRTGVPDVLPIISQYIYGTAENMQEFTPSYINFVKSVALYSLHGIVGRHPEEILTMVVPVFFNETETPKIRTAAFGVLVKCQPSLEILQHIAVHSWQEQSNEVGSFVTSTLESFGNATLPCMQLTASRIRQVFPLMKKFDIGVQHAKNVLLSYFDEIRNFGLKGRLAYVPNNATFIPSNIYQSLSYSMDSLKDTIVETALNIEGLTQRKIFQFIDQYVLGISPAETIPPTKENEIFEEARIIERIPETLRFTLYQRLFYSKSFYYLDLNNLRPQIDTLKEYLEAYMKRTSFDYSGHLVKVLLPSTFHTVTIARTLPFPVEFQMHRPMVFALKVESKERNPTLPNFHFLVRPSVYITRHYTIQMKNLDDCKEVGTYHEHKMAVSYPVQVKLQVESLTNITVSYKMPELPKKVLYYFTEAGTYVGRKTLTTFPSSEDREPIRKLPSPFKNSTVIQTIGVPPIHAEWHTEEIGLVTENIPTNPMEIVEFAVQRVLNAGWRYKALNLTVGTDSRVWPKNTEVTFNLQYNTTHVTRRNLRMGEEHKSSQWPDTGDVPDYEWISTEAPETEDDSSHTDGSSRSMKWPWSGRGQEEEGDDDWFRDLRPDDIPRNKNPSTFADQARKLSSKLSHVIPHIAHVFEVMVETRPKYSKAYIRMEYNHTHSKTLHAVHADAAINDVDGRHVQMLSLDHLMAFFRRPDEFHYDTHADDHSAVFITGLRFHPVNCYCPWKDMEVVTKGIFTYEPLDTLLNEELESKVKTKYFLSEEHDLCLEDIRNGQPLSENCFKAMRERSIYNKLRMSILWNKNLPQHVRNWARNVDIYMKHVFYNHMSINYEPNTQNKIHVRLNHIDKLTDEPVFDFVIEKPQETITFRRLRAMDDPLSSLHDLRKVDLLELTNNTYPPTCVMMEKYLRTYDLRTYPLSLDRCNYVLSAHCIDYKNFAIIAKILSTDGTKEIHMHVGQHTLVLSPPSGNHYTVKYDGQDYTVNEPIVFDEDSAEIYAYPEIYTSGHKHLQVIARRAGIRVIYTGKFVKVQIHPRYKGETCGLCSEFDGETVREYRGMDRCLYSHPDDFVNSAITNKQACRKEPMYPYVCEQDTGLGWGKNSDDEYPPTIKRNVVVTKGNEVCFSVLPVPVCEAEAKPTKTQSVSIGFHCLPKNDITARRMISEAKRRSLGEIENKKIDYEDVVDIATMC